MLFKKNKTAASKKELMVIQLFTFIEIPIGQLTAEIFYWGEADWWPGSVPFKFLKTTAGDADLGHAIQFQTGRFYGARRSF